MRMTIRALLKQHNLNCQNATHVMKMQNAINRVIISATQSKWTRPALMALTLLVTVIGLSGCSKHH